MSLGKCCISGVKHEGTPVGNIVDYDGTAVYESFPSADYDKCKALLFLPDVFGIGLNNGKLLADSYAAEGFAVYVPDYLNGDPIPEGKLGSPDFDLGAWFGKHGSDVTRPPLDKVIAALKAKGVTSFAATGYCLGGRYVADLVLDDVLKVAIVAHPSLIKVPEDLEAIKKHSVPFLWNTCEVDQYFPPEAQAAADKIFADDKNYKRTYWKGCSHGYAVRGDPSNPDVKAGKEGTFEASVKFLKENF